MIHFLQSIHIDHHCAALQLHQMNSTAISLRPRWCSHHCSIFARAFEFSTFLMILISSYLLLKLLLHGFLSLSPLPFIRFTRLWVKHLWIYDLPLITDLNCFVFSTVIIFAVMLSAIVNEMLSDQGKKFSCGIYFTWT